LGAIRTATFASRCGATISATTSQPVNNARRPVSSLLCPGPPTEAEWCSRPTDPSRGPSPRLAEGVIRALNRWAGSGSGCVKTLRGICTRNFEACGRVQSNKTLKFILRSPLRPNRISFLHSLDPYLTSALMS
jgi:hypothetical protein